MIIIILIILYCLIFIIILFLLNPLAIYVSYKIILKLLSFLKGIKNTLYEKLKKKAINKKLRETNKSKYCIDHKIKWELGLSGYWLEIKKIKKDAELEER